MAYQVKTPKDAIVGIVVGAIHADGKVLRQEVQTASLHLEALEELGVTPMDVTSRLQDLEAQIAAEGTESFLANCAAAVPAEMRSRAFRATVEVLGADATVHEGEEAYLHLLAAQLKVPADVAGAILGSRIKSG